MFGWVRLSVLRLLTGTAQLLLDAGADARGTNIPKRVASREVKFGSYEIALESVRFYGLGYFKRAGEVEMSCVILVLRNTVTDRKLPNTRW